MAGPRNQHGVNDASNCYRTVAGVRFEAWMSCPSADRIAAYRNAGVRCRRFGEELFIHPLDEDMASEIDRRSEA